MEALETLQRRIAVSRDLEEIVRTMKTLSAVTIRRCERASAAVRAYDETIDQGLQILLRDPGVAEMALRTSEEVTDTGPLGLIAIGSDHGFCGRFNTVAAQSALDEVRAASGGSVLSVAVGARLADRLASEGHTVSVIYRMPGSVTGIAETTGSLLAHLDDWRRTAGVERVRIVHNVRSAGAAARPVSLPLFPISTSYLRHQATRPWPSRRLPTFAEDRNALLKRLLRQHVFVRVFRALAEAQASEHAARLNSMQAAERNIKDRLAEMNTSYLRQRQAQITTELLDVVSAADAVSGRD